MLSLLSLHLLLALSSLTSASSAVIDLLPSTFDAQILQSHKPALVEFFAPWCGHCKTLAPVYEQLGQAFAHADGRVAIAKVDADEHKALARRFGVQGFPTLKWFDGESDKPEDYKGGRDLESLTRFVTERTGVRPRGGGGKGEKNREETTSLVAVLDDGSFEGSVGGNRSVLVAFTAPWCGHCKTLAPVWEALARDFAREPSILIAKVDAESPTSKSTAEAHSIEGYPTIKFFAAGSRTPQPYSGDRTEIDLVSFLNAQAGTHRLVGGSLDDDAGTVPALDAYVAKLALGEDAAAVKAEVETAIEHMNDDDKKNVAQAAAYYLRVFAKMVEDAGFVPRELERLQRLLAKADLAPEKTDQLVKRRNVLRRFGPVKERPEQRRVDEL